MLLVVLLHELKYIVVDTMLVMMLLVVLLCVLKYIVDTMLAIVAPSSPAGWVGMHCCWYHSCYEYSIIFCPAVDVEMMKWWCRACYINATGWLFCCVICNILLIPCLLWMLVLAVLQQVLRWINDVTLVMNSPCSVCVCWNRLVVESSSGTVDWDWKDYDPVKMVPTCWRNMKQIDGVCTSECIEITSNNGGLEKL